MWRTAGLYRVYVIGAMSAYEYAFLIIDLRPDREHPNPPAQRRAKLALLAWVNARVSLAGRVPAAMDVSPLLRPNSSSALDVHANSDAPH